MQTTTVVVTGKASGKGTLFKAISEKDIAKAIKEKTSIVVDPSQITMEHFKKKGDYTVSISLSGRKATVPVRVESKA